VRLTPGPRSLDLVQLVRLYVEGWSEAALADLIRVHPARMPAILAEVLKEVEALTRREAENWILVQLRVFDLNIEQNLRAVLNPCLVCGGDKQRRISCRACEQTGYPNPPIERTKALRRINGIAQRRIKLLALNKPTPRPASGDPPPPKDDSPLTAYVVRKLKEELARLEGDEATISDEALQEAAERTDQLAEFALERELLLTGALIREAAEIIVKKCAACADQQPQRANCKDCGRSGHLYNGNDRLTALKCISNAQEHRIKLLGIDRQPPPGLDPDPELAAFFDSLETATTEELEAELGLPRSRTSELPE
jgi:hypothetical protein